MTDIDTIRATLGDKAKRIEQIGGQVLIQGDCLEHSAAVHHCFAVAAIAGAEVVFSGGRR